MSPVTYESLRALRPDFGGEETLSVRGVVRRFCETPEDPVNMNPDYQRGSVWTDDQCAKFLGFIAEGGTAPPIFVQRYPGYGKPDELLDGLQRISAVLRFYRNEVPLETTDGERMYLRDFTPEDQKILCGNAGPCLTIKYVKYEKRADILRFYIRLNRGGTVHSDAEIDRVKALLSAEDSP